MARVCTAAATCSFHAGAGHGCWGGGEGKSASPPRVCGDGWAFLWTSQPRKTLSGLGNARVGTRTSLPSTVLCGTHSFRRLPKLPAAVLFFRMLFLQIVAVQMHLCIFPSLSHPFFIPPTPQEGSFAKSYRIRLERKHAEFVQRELSLPAAHLPCLQLCPVPKHCPC